MPTKRTIAALLLAAAIGVAACGGSDGDDDAAPATTAAPEAPPEAAPVAVKSTDSDFGTILTDVDGMTLYAFTNDTEAQSTCFSTCADAWPPLLVPEEWQVGPGLDSAVFSTVERGDGQHQLMAGRFPLYTFSGDAAPGDTTGQASGAVWFVVAPDASIIQDAPAGGGEEAETPPTTVAIAETDVGDALVDAAGLTLYGFLPDDGEHEPTCVDACADAWPPLLVDGDTIPAGLDPELFTVIARGDGSSQLVAGKWPLYRFAGDAAPGDANGQGSGDNWFVVAPDGGLIR